MKVMFWRAFMDEIVSLQPLDKEKVLAYWLASLQHGGGDDDRAIAALQKAYKKLQEQTTCPALLEQVLGHGETIREIPTGETWKEISLTHCAMVNRGGAEETPVIFPLDPSQRLAVRQFLSLKEMGAIAVSGAPGTGKTDMLRAAISSIWTKAALEQQPCPIILICGATNQSVENVMTSFDGAVEASCDITLRSRWIAGLQGYAVSCPSTNKKEDHEARFQTMKIDRNDIEYGGNAETLGQYQAEDLPTMVSHFVSMMVEAFLGDGKTIFPLSLLGFSSAQVRTLEQMKRRSQHQDREEARFLIQDSAKFLWELLNKAHQLQETVRQQLHKGLFTNSFQGSSLWKGVEIFASSFSPQPGVDLALGKLKAALNASTEQYKEAVEGAIDVLLRPVCFHLAGRYWEARWLADFGKEAIQAPKHLRLRLLRRNAMLFPCLVSTLHSAPRLMQIYAAGKEDYLFSALDMLVVDESGQASPSIAGVVLAFARKLLVVGDVKQLAPVSSVSPEEDRRRAADFTNIHSHWEKRGILESSGSVMRLVSTGASWSEPDRHGILLRRHYRCLETIIGYCIELLYHDHERDMAGNILQQELQPQVPDIPLMDWEASEGKGFPLPAMSFVQCGSVNDIPTKGGEYESWTNRGEALKIIHWLQHDGQRLVAWYAARGKEVDITDVVAILTPFAGQAKLLRDLLAEHSDQKDDETHLGKRMVIGTVHTMQGAERDVILFSGVSQECIATSKQCDDSYKVFLDRDGGNLLNVAVSRAKKAFILFGHADLFFSPQAMRADNDLPTALLGRYMVRKGVKIAPKALVIVESPLKAKAIQTWLPDTFEVYGTGGHIRDLATLELTPDNSFHPLWELINPDRTCLTLQRTMTRLLQTPYLILATDPDPQGEAIAWHVLQVLKQHPWFAHVRVISRVVFSSITEAEIRSAFRSPRNILMLEDGVQPEAVLDSYLVEAALALRILDGTIGHYYWRKHHVGMGRVQSAILHLLAGTGASAYVLDVVLTDNNGTLCSAQLLDMTDIGDGAEMRFKTRQEAEQTAARLQGRVLPDYGFLDEVIEIILPPAPLGTADVLALAWERYEFTPQYTTSLLQQLYTGGGGDGEARDNVQYLPNKPLVTLTYGRLSLTDEGWRMVGLLETKESSLSSIASAERMEADLDAIAEGDESYATVVQSWSREIFQELPFCTPDPTGTFGEGDLWEGFPDVLPENEHHSIADEQTFANFLANIPPAETTESRASSSTSMSGSLAHPPLMPLEIGETESDSLLDDARMLLHMIQHHCYATVGREALCVLQPVLYLSRDGTMGLLVQAFLRIEDEGFYALYPQAKSDLDRLYAPSSLLKNPEIFRIQVAGIRPADYPPLTPSNTLLLMQRMGLGRPSTYAEHFRKLTAVE
jgi:DNA topoisomerase IA